MFDILCSNVEVVNMKCLNDGFKMFIDYLKKKTHMLIGSYFLEFIINNKMLRVVQNNRAQSRSVTCSCFPCPPALHMPGNVWKEYLNNNATNTLIFDP